MRTIGELPPDLTRIVFDLGPRKLVLLEGPTDCEVFREWYREKLSEVEFYPSSGNTNAQEFLQAILVHSTAARAYGIIDRDFREDTEVDRPLSDPTAHLFILRRYSLENYLLEPEAVFEELRVSLGETFTLPDVSAIEQALLELVHRLDLLTAVHWVFHEVGGIEYFHPGDERILGPELVSEAARRLGCTEEEATKRVHEKMAILAACATSLHSAYVYVSGKHLLHLCHREFIAKAKGGLSREPWRRTLARSVKQHPGLHADIRAIMEERILRA